MSIEKTYKDCESAFYSLNNTVNRLECRNKLRLLGFSISEINDLELNVTFTHRRHKGIRAKNKAKKLEFINANKK